MTLQMTTDLSLLEKLEQLIDPLIKESNLVLFDLGLHQHHGTCRIEIFVDNPQGGITIDQCTALNRRIGFALEEQQLISQHYTLEVSSPGLDRPLKTKKDFLRILGQSVHFFLSQPVLNKLEHIAIVQKADDDAVVVLIVAQEVSIPLDIINKAKLHLK